MLGPSEARRFTDQVKRDAAALWRKLIELYEGGAWSALNYTSWHEYCKAEFGFGRSQSYRLLDAGRVAKAIPPVGEWEPGPRASIERTANGADPSLLINERQAREFVPLLRAEDEDAVVEVFSELKAEHGEKLTAETVREAVKRKLAPKAAAKTNGHAPRPPRDDLVVAQETLAVAYTKAGRLIAGFLEKHPEQGREDVCRRVAPRTWPALDAIVRQQEAKL
jgi:hypothetical protein